MHSDIKSITSRLISAGKTLHDLGMVPATSGNFSARLNNKEIAITVSGVHKGRLSEDDIIIHALDGAYTGDKIPSAETELHLQLYRKRNDINAVLHSHSQAATLTRNLQTDKIVLQGYELLKAFEGIKSHETTLAIPIFENDQNIGRLSLEIGKHIDDNPEIKAYIIRGHGFYTWAGTIEKSIQHCEALEFLLQCEIKSSGIGT